MSASARSFLRDCLWFADVDPLLCHPALELPGAQARGGGALGGEIHRRDEERHATAALQRGLRETEGRPNEEHATQCCDNMHNY